MIYTVDNAVTDTEITAAAKVFSTVALAVEAWARDTEAEAVISVTATRNPEPAPTCGRHMLGLALLVDVKKTSGSAPGVKPVSTILLVRRA